MKIFFENSGQFRYCLIEYIGYVKKIKDARKRVYQEEYTNASKEC